MPKQPIITPGSADPVTPPPARSAASKTRRPPRKKPPRAKPKNPQAGRLAIQTIAVSKINPAPYNPRKALKPGDPEYARLKRSMEVYSYVDPLIWNKRTGNLVGGHQRLTILTREFGVTEVDVSVVDLDDNAEKALNVALNKIDGEWDDDGLAALLLDLQTADYDATLTGFDETEIDAMLAELDGDDSGGGGAGSVDTPVDKAIKSIREIIIQCETEADQNALFTELKGRGLTCRMSVLL